MERKSTQRIIGVLVIIALVIILLPLLFGKNDMLTQAATIKAPPFPDQQTADNDVQVPPETATQDSVQISEGMAAQLNNDSPTEIPIEVTNTTATSVAASADSQAANALTNPPLPEEAQSLAQQPSVDNLKNSQAVDAPSVSIDQASISDTANVIDSQTPDNTLPGEKKTGTTLPKKIDHLPKSNSHAKNTQAIHANAWAVQLGSFKVKQNAIKLADKLRAAGYKAFTRDFHASTRVYVGPESKHASALNLSNQIKNRTHLDGIIVAFKPLEL